MTEQILMFFTAMLTAVVLENAVFTRGLGLGRYALFMRGPKQGILYGGLLTWIATLSSLMVAGINNAIMDHPLVLVIRAPLFFLSVAMVYIFTYLMARAYLPGKFADIAGALPFSTFNTAVFGAFYISVMHPSVNVIRTLGYCFGMGVGYTLALYIVYFARKRLSISPVPRAFRGLPILLLYIGMISLALYGLTGHGLVN